EPVSAIEIEAQAADWLQRRHVWSWTHEDQEKLDAWLGENIAHRVAYVRLEAAWGRAETLADMRPASRRLPQLASGFIFLRSVAATLLAVALVIGAIYVL